MGKNNRWVSDIKLEAWIDTQLRELDEWAGHGSSMDALHNSLGDRLMCLMTEDMKPIDTYDYVNGGISFGQDAERLDCKIFSVYYLNINFYFLAKNKTELKKMIQKAMTDWRKECEPIDYEQELPEEDIIEELLKDIYAHIKDPRGRSSIESNWCERIEKLYGERIKRLELNK